MGTALIGYTGFVGGSLARQGKFNFLFNSTNIAGIEGMGLDLLVVAGVRAVKWWANQNPEADRESIESLLRPLKKVSSRETIVISTIDVYPDPRGVDEATSLEGLDNHAYGRNRLMFEQEMRNLFPLVRVIRLPGLFGQGLKKNVIFDLIHNNGLDKINPGSVFQYYDLSRLTEDMEAVRRLDLALVNFATEPVPTHAILDRFFPQTEVGQAALPAAFYDMKTLHAAAFGGSDGYFENREQVLSRIGNFLGSSSLQ